ncbi:metal-sensitive transcriptional regulator [Leptospira sp. GIMC2001]|uniref:metal-sensitive transcriptional regulator n=1 Tax=Leptospira sp. GIMC2001 TaxID=1513297 RepID=UPI0023496D98|nr:metal-sensitive transcriptional regulator [Leptospira sp. GIMC2001]WCL49471.1 metal-sensitive transcriptional regulator [Leptospira sp. GIMC2001]
MVTKKEMDKSDLINRLNRIQGQIEALKKVVNDPEAECMKAMQLLKAANNALKKFGESYVSRHLDECLRSKNSIQEMESDLKNVISASFFL